MRGEDLTGFQSTNWMLLSELQQSDEERAAAALNDLAGIYWPPIYAYLRRSGFSQQDAADLTQGFFADVILARELLHRAEPAESRLRSLILAALRRFLADQHRRSQARGAKGFLTSERVAAEEAAFRYAERDDDSISAFDRRWAVTILEETLSRCRRRYEESGRPDHWQLFDERVIRPTRYGTQPSPVVELAARLGFASSAHASAALQVVRRRVSAMLRDAARETVIDPGDSDDEIDHLLELLR